MKKFILTLLLTVVTVTMMAIPAKRGLWSTIKLADGTEVLAEMKGDEHAHWMQSADGVCYVMNGDVYEIVDAQTIQARRQARLQLRSAKRRAIYASTSDGLGEKGKMSMGSVPSIGEYTIPVVMVQFSDTKFKSTTTVEKMTRYYNEEGYHDENGCVGSVRDYFMAQSGGQFVPTFDVVGIVTLSKAATYYGSNDSNGSDEKLDDLPGDVISAAINQLGADFSKYVVPAGDENHQAGVPLLAMFYAGKGEATEEETNANKKLIWPCEWDDVEDTNNGDYNNFHFNSFFVGNELLGSKLMGMSVFCHEFGHALGLPDFYVTDYSYENDDAFGLWSIMDCGAYVDDECRAPMGYTAYEKSFMGWLELKEIGDVEEITLQSPEGLAEQSAYIIRNSSNETFIFENRQPGTWYPARFGSGVMATRIAYGYNYWNSNTLNNTQNKKRACVLTADGTKLSYSAASSNLYGNGKNSIATLKTLNNKSADIAIKTITKNNDGTITLTMGEVSGSGSDDDDPVKPTKEGALFYESFDQCDGTGGNDGTFSGSVGTASKFKTDNSGWTANEDKYYGCDRCAKFGTSSVKGEVTSPSFAVDGTGTMTFMAAPFGTDGTTLNLSVSNGTISPATVTMKAGEFTNFTATITATGNVKVTFTPAKRLFLDEVLVVDPNATGIQTVSSYKAMTTTRIYTIDGRYVGADPNQLPRGLYIINGKKIVK